ncbi:MAG: AraC family transcriptional regulator [Reichenbachiella sp.]
MLKSRQKFDYKGRTLIEKIIVEPPFRHESLFQNEGCFLYVSGGKSSFNSSNQQIALTSTDSVLLKCGRYIVDVMQEFENDLIEIYAIHLYPEVLKKLYENELPSFIKTRGDSPFIKKVVSQQVVSKYMEGIDFYFVNPTIVNDDLLELKIKELILILIQTKNASSILDLMADLFTPKSVNLREVVSAHLYTNLSVEKLAELSHMSVSTFKREFKTTFGDAPIRYLNQKKLSRAAELLLATDQSISQVAYEVGFSDPAYFARLFKTAYGLSPNQYKSTL